MLLRAVFWIGLVSLLMPHEPNLGFGRPHFGPSPATSAWIDRASPENICKGREAACGSGLSFLESFQAVAIRSLAQVKAEIEASQHERLMHGHDS